MKTFNHIPVTDIFDAKNSEELFREYAKESKSELMPESIPDKDIYKELEEQYLLHCVGAYDNGTLVGFIVGLITPNFHHSTKGMTIESIFVLPEHRTGGTAKGLVYRLEVIAKANDCSTMFLGGRIGHIEKRAKALGFTPTSVISVKDIR